MPLQIPAPTEKTYKLLKADPTGDTYVTIAQARQREHERRAELFAEASRVWREGDQAVEVKQKVSMAEVARIEVELTIRDCNILDEDGQPLFRFAKNPNGTQRLAMSTTSFAVAYGKLPPEVADEIRDFVLAVNPQWGPNPGE